MTQAIAQMEKVTQTTAATAEESAASSEELTAQAEATMRVVRRMEQIVGLVHAGQPQAPAPAAVSRKLTVVAGKKDAPAATAPQQSWEESAEARLPLGDTGTYGRF